MAPARTAQSPVHNLQCRKQLGSGFRTVLHHVGKSDGIQKSWVDGKLVFQRSDVRYRFDREHKIERFVWQNFDGGSPTSSSAPKFQPIQDQSIEYAAVPARCLQHGRASITVLLFSLHCFRDGICFIYLRIDDQGQGTESLNKPMHSVVSPTSGTSRPEKQSIYTVMYGNLQVEQHSSECGCF